MRAIAFAYDSHTACMQLREDLCQQYEWLSRLFCTLVEATICLHLNALLSSFHTVLEMLMYTNRTMDTNG